MRPNKLSRLVNSQTKKAKVLQFYVICLLVFSIECCFVALVVPVLLSLCCFDLLTLSKEDILGGNSGADFSA